MNKHAKRNLAAGAACAVGLGVLVAPTTAVAAPITVDPATTAVVNLLSFNDFHGRLGENAAQDDGSVVESAELYSFLGEIEALRADYPESTVLISNGDNIGASAFTSMSQEDAPTLELLNIMDVEASAAGNHEFDRGVDDLTGRVDDLADFPYLAANVSRDGEAIGPEFEIAEVDGVRVGIVGAVTQETPSLVSRDGIEGVDFGSTVDAVNRVAAELTDGDDANGEADVVVATIHEGADVELEPNAPQDVQAAALTSAGGGFADQLQNLSDDVDVVFNGHTHRVYSWLAPANGGTPYLQASQYGEMVGQIVVEVDRATGDVTVEAENVVNHEIATPDFTDDEVYSSGAEMAAAADSYIDELAAAWPRVAEARDYITGVRERAQVIGQEVVGQISGPISVPNGSNGNRSEESTMAQVVANMYRDQLADPNRGGAEIGIVNPGGVRDSWEYQGEDGELDDVTLQEVNLVLPFINNLWTGTVTGEQLDTVLEQQWQRDESGSTEGFDRPYLQLGLSDNVTYVSDPTRPLDDRVSDIQVNGEFITPEQEIRISTSSFLLAGGDNFWEFGEATDARDSGFVDLDAFLAYIGDNQGLAPDYTVRHVDVTGLPEGPLTEGEEVTAAIAQLDRIRSIGAAPSTEVEVVDEKGDVIGSGAVVVNEDAAGAPLTTSADVTFTPTIVDRAAAAPVAEPVTQTYEIRTDNGTVVPFQVLVAPAPEATEPPVDTEEPTETPAPSAPADGDDDGGQAGGGSLPQTGGEVSPMLWVGAGLLVLIGAALLIVGRLRRAEQ